jgi:hypothetical protein
VGGDVEPERTQRACGVSHRRALRRSEALRTGAAGRFISAFQLRGRRFERPPLCLAGLWLTHNTQASITHVEERGALRRVSTNAQPLPGSSKETGLGGGFAAGLVSVAALSGSPDGGRRPSG